MYAEISLVDWVERTLAVAPHDESGRLIGLPASRLAFISVPASYGDVLRFVVRRLVDCEPGMEWYELLDGYVAGDVYADLSAASELLGNEPYPDFEAATWGNVGRVVDLLRAWSREHPTGTWQVC